jgi:CelD/BcsL family acetyltransferase involved in cellulose biosynthesis
LNPRIIDICAEPRWAELEGHAYASLFTSRPWIAALARTYGLDCRAVVIERGGRIEAALPFVQVADIRGERVPCLPFSDFCDPLVTEPADWQALVAPLLDLEAPVSVRCLRNPLPVQDPRFTRHGQAVWHGVDLRRPEETIWSSLKGSARQNVRKAGRHGVTVREGRSLADVELFHAMHCHVRKSKYRLLAQPLAFFEQLHAAFAPDDQIIVLLAELNGRTIGGILLLQWQDTLYYKFNASTEAAFCPNDLLAWESLRLGRRRGLARLDFGLSDPAQSGLVRYKRKYATEERVIHQLVFPSTRRLAAHEAVAGRVLGRLTELLTRPEVPDTVTSEAGDALYRYFA